MCRIVGGIDFSGKGLLTESIVESMRDELSHGGPDSYGIFAEGNIIFGHRRLSIIELSESGKQPMVFENWVIVFNGEIYNYKEIRSVLEEEGIVFRTNSDTEVIVKSFERWGVKSVDRFRGMFAFAIWNRKEKKMTLCRDRFGVKPLYVYSKGGLFLFASELKAFHKHPHFDKTINVDAIPHYLLRGFINESDCIYLHVNKVKPGCYLHVNSNGDIIEEKYWDVENILLNAEVKNKAEEENLEQLEEILLKSFSLRMISDVPVGVFLSGGIDSTLVTAILQKHTNKSLQTYNIAFEDKYFNEGLIAQNISEILGTNHNSIVCNEQDFLNVIPKLSYIFDEPFGDSSAIPTYLLSKYARKNVKVALSGDGGDELFGGYAKYKFIYENSKYLKIPRIIRNRIMDISYLLNPIVFEKLVSPFSNNSYTQISSKFFKLRQAFGSENIVDFFNSSSSYLSDKQLRRITSTQFHKFQNRQFADNPEKLISTFGYWDMQNFLPSDVLTKVDRASMSVALETREPFLDPEIIDFSFSLPNKFKISETGETKVLLKKLLSKYLPNEIMDRPKFGFTVPIDTWMRRNLKLEIIHMLSENSFFDTFLLNQKEISKICNNYFENKNSINPHTIWFIYCLYKWYQKWV